MVRTWAMPLAARYNENSLEMNCSPFSVAMAHRIPHQEKSCFRKTNQVSAPRLQSNYPHMTLCAIDSTHPVRDRGMTAWCPCAIHDSPQHVSSALTWKKGVKVSAHPSWPAILNVGAEGNEEWVCCRLLLKFFRRH